jgi:tetratricopeptide (TPR) repeat protein
MAKQANPKKAEKHEHKGDELLARGKSAKALSEYRKALHLDPERRGIYDKLLAAKDQLPGEWTQEDFAESLSWAMNKQEQEHPSIRQLHAKLTPEWKRATELAVSILAAPEDMDMSSRVEELIAMGEIATRALLGILLEFKHGTASDEAPVLPDQS